MSTQDLTARSGTKCKVMRRLFFVPNEDNLAINGGSMMSGNQVSIDWSDPGRRKTGWGVERSHACGGSSLSIPSVHCPATLCSGGQGWSCWVG